jgi:nicotinate-nucleotide adenylyltransferase
VSARDALETGYFHRVLFVPTGQNPLKPDGTEAGPDDRLAMVRRAIAGTSAFSAHDIESRERTASYTIDTVTRLIERGELAPRPGLLVGDDIIDHLDRWKDIQKLLDIVRLVVVRRRASFRDASLPQGTVFIEKAPLAVSAREIRRRLHEGFSIRYLVPDSVYEYIQERHLYSGRD